MAKLTNSPGPLKFTTGIGPIPTTAGADNSQIKWLTNVLSGFAKDKNTLFNCATFLANDLLDVCEDAQYVLFFPAIADPVTADAGQRFKSLLAVGSSDNVYMMKGNKPICLSTESVPVANNLPVDNMKLVGKFVTPGNDDSVWTAASKTGPFSAWAAGTAPTPSALPFKNVAISNDDIKTVLSLNGCKKLGLIPVSLRRNKNKTNRNTLVMVGLNQQNQILWPAADELWVCDEAVNKYGVYPPWKSSHLNSTWS